MANMALRWRKDLPEQETIALLTKKREDGHRYLDFDIVSPKEEENKDIVAWMELPYYTEHPEVWNFFNRRNRPRKNGMYICCLNPPHTKLKQLLWYDVNAHDFSEEGVVAWMQLPQIYPG